MRILQVHTRYRQAGGEDSVVTAERGLLERAGHLVELTEFVNPEGASESIPLAIRSPWNGGAAAAVVASAGEFGADVVHVHNTWFALSPAVFPALAAAGFPVVATMHNYRLACANAMFYRDGRICTDCLDGSPLPGIAHRCYRSSAAQSALVAATISLHRSRSTWEKVNRVIALTDFAADILKRSGVPDDRVVVKPNVVADPGDRAALPSESRRVLFVGRLTEEKGILDLIEAWTTARPDGLELHIVGEGPLGVHCTGREDRSIFLRNRLTPQEVSREMQTARALVVPSRWFEGLPMVVVEAFAHGLGVVAPDHGAFPDVVGDGGMTFGGCDVDDLARRLGELGDLAVDALGAGGRSMFERHYSADKGLRDLEAIYARAVSETVR